MNKYWCDNCNFTCNKKDHWKQHINSLKHKRKLTDERYAEGNIQCIHCNEFFTKESYKRHKERNQLFWLCKNSYWTDFCSCNNFVSETGKRYEDIRQLKDVMEKKGRYGYNKKKLDDEYGKLWLEKLEKDKHRDLKFKQLKEQRDNKLREEIENKNKKVVIKSPSPPPSPTNSDDSYISDVEKPIIDEDQYCDVCGGTYNDDENPIKILEHFKIKLCNCGDSSDEEIKEI